jgi:uncharacterized protein GlcG (DUF336 family)
VSIPIDLARRVLEAAKMRANELRSPVSIAIVDAGGHLVLFERMMAPFGYATGLISQAKANTAVMFNQSTDAIAQWAGAIPGFSASLASMTDGKFILAAGGWPIRVNGVTVGGIGVSGGNAPGRDDEIARAALAAVEPAPRPQQPYYQAPPQQSQYLPQLQQQPVYAAPATPRQPSVPVASPQASAYGNYGGNNGNVLQPGSERPPIPTPATESINTPANERELPTSNSENEPDPYHNTDTNTLNSSHLNPNSNADTFDEKSSSKNVDHAGDQL